jgi:hypothetical protein
MAKQKNKKTQKPKKEKVIYYDDNSTIADMSKVGRKGQNQTPPTPSHQDPNMRKVKPYSTGRDKWNTYWSAVKMMFVPMLIVLGVMTVLYVLLLFLTN